MSEEERESTSSGERRRLSSLIDRRVVVDTSLKAKDPIQQFLDDEDSELIREVRRTKLQALLKKYKEEAGLNDDGRKKAQEMANQPIPPELILELSKMPDEQREKALEIYQRLVIAQKSGENNWALPLAIGAVQGNPSASKNDVGEFAASLAKMFETGVTVAKQASTQIDPLNLVKTTAEIIEKAHPQEGQQQQSYSNPIADALAVLDEFEKRGLLAKPSPQQPESLEVKKLEIELEKLRTERDLKLRQLDLEFQKEARKMGIEEKKIETLTSGVERIARAAGTAFGEGEQEGTSSSVPAGVQALPTTREAILSEFPCQVCGTRISIPEPDKARQITCPKCESVYEYKPPGGK
jgi:hypothetical protein